MKLSEDLYDRYIEFSNAVGDGKSVDDAASFRRKIATRWIHPDFIVPILDRDGQRIIGDLRYISTGRDEYDPGARSFFIAELRKIPADTIGEEVLVAGIMDCIEGVKNKAVAHFSTRIQGRNLTKSYRRALERCGFRFVVERMEFKTRIDAMTLVPDNGIGWKDAGSIRIEDACSMYARCNAGERIAGQFDLREHFHELAGRSRVTENPAMIQIGHVDGHPMAVLILSVDVKNGGWCTMLFVGIVPEFRGKGYGRKVHSHGIRVLRYHGGILYHDSTDAANEAMLRVFERQGCVVHMRNLEFERLP